MNALVDLNPEVVIINDRVINMELLEQYILNDENYSIKLIWLDGKVDGLKFDNLYQARAALGKLEKAMHYMLYED